MKTQHSSAQAAEAAPPTPQRKKNEIFLSHSGRQKGFARDLGKRLCSLHYTVFFDQNHDSLPPGQAFPPLIFEAADTCRLALVVISHDFITTKWPMIELCRLVDRLSLQSPPDVPAVPFTILPLFYKLSPADIKAKENVEKWRKEWKRLEEEDAYGRINAAKFEEVVTKVLPLLSGVVRLPESDQGDSSYIEDVVNRSFSIILPRNLVRIRYGVDPHKKYVGIERMCKVILDEYEALESPRSSSDEQSGSMDCCILGMYGVPGSGKSTICDFLLDIMFDDFKGKVIRLELPTVLMGGDDPRVKEQYAKLLGMLYPHRNDFSLMDLERLYALLLGACFNHKMFLVLDNISASNCESYETMANAIISSATLGPGSRVMLVAQTRAILKDMLVEIKHKYTVTQVPCLLEEEAKELMRNHYSSATEDVLARLTCKCRFQSSSSLDLMYLPFVFEQIGILLSKRQCNDLKEVEELWKMVDKGKKNAIEKLVDMNFKQLPRDLQVLFFDIALFIIPAGYSKLSDTCPILCSMHGIIDTFELEWKIMELQKHCALSVIDGGLKVHDIFTEYARSLPENYTSYVNKALLGTSDSLVMHTREQRGSNRPTIYSGTVQEHLKCSEARTMDIHIGKCTKCGHEGNEFPEHIEVVSDDQEIRWLHVEVGATARALLVRSMCGWCKCALRLSGDLSYLLWLRIVKMEQVALWPLGCDMDLSGLVRLEIKNENIARAQDIRMRTSTVHKRGWMSNFLDLIRNQFEKSRQVPYARQFWYSVLSGRRITQLRVIILSNAGIRRIEIVGRYCPQLEVLEVKEGAQRPIDVSVHNTPNLERLVVGRTEKFFYGKPSRRRKLSLQLEECLRLREIHVDGSFYQLKAVGFLPSSLRRLRVATHKCSRFVLANWISSSVYQLSLLEKLHLSCGKVERMDFTSQGSQGGLPGLKKLVVYECHSLTHIWMGSGYMPNLVDLRVLFCEKLEVMEGVEHILMDGLKSLSWHYLPKLQVECDVGRGSSWEAISSSRRRRRHLQHLEQIDVRGCPGVKIDGDVLMRQASESMRLMWLRDVGMVGMQQKIRGDEEEEEDGNVEEEKEALLLLTSSIAVPPLDCRLTFSEEGRFFTRLWYLHLERIPHLREIAGIQHLPQLLVLYLEDLPHLVRVSGTWPTSLVHLGIKGCPMLLDVPRRLEQMSAPSPLLDGSKESVD